MTETPLSGTAVNLPSTLSPAELFLDSPVVIFGVSDFLNADYYAQLSGEFPSLTESAHKQHDIGRKKYLDNSSEQFWQLLNSHPAWQHLYQFFASQSTIDTLYSLSHSYLGHRPRPERLPWLLEQPPIRSGGMRSAAKRRLGRTACYRILGPRLNALRRRTTRQEESGRESSRTGSFKHREVTPVYIGFELSELRYGDRIPPHTDSANKLLSLMIYFPEDSEQMDLPLGTEFYGATSDAVDSLRSWETGTVRDDDLPSFFASHSTYFQVPYAANMLVGFFKTADSWHGLAHVDLPPHQTRRAVVINVFSCAGAGN